MKRINHLFLNSGYPPLRGFHCHRALIRMQDFLKTTVISIRAININRLFKKKYKIDGIEVEEIYVPVLPKLNKKIELVRIQAYFSYFLIYERLKEAEILESGSLYPSGEIIRLWVKLGKIDGIAKVSDAIGDDVKIDIKKLKKERALNILRTFDVILSNSNDMTEDLKMNFENVPLIINAYRGVDFEKFHSKVPSKGPFRENSFPRFLYLGGFPKGDLSDLLNDVKGGIYLLEAWKIFEKVSQKGVLIIGGPNSDNWLIKEWRRQLKFPDRVEIIGRIDYEEVPNYLNGADVVVIPSISEGLPNLSNEAQACEKPLLGTNAGGIPETVENGHTGYIVKKGSVFELFNGLMWFVKKDKREIEEMGKIGRERVLKFFTWDNYREKAIIGYDYALKKNGINYDLKKLLK